MAYRLALTALYFTLVTKQKYWQNAKNPEWCLHKWTSQQLVHLVQQEENTSTSRRPRLPTTPFDDLTPTNDPIAAIIARSPEESLEISRMGEQIERLCENQTLSLDAALLLQYRLEGWSDRDAAEYLELSKRELNTAARQISRRATQIWAIING
jgi:hypothetical protein